MSSRLLHDLDRAAAELRRRYQLRARLCGSRSRAVYDRGCWVDESAQRLYLAMRSELSARGRGAGDDRQATSLVAQCEELLGRRRAAA